MQQDPGTGESRIAGPKLLKGPEVAEILSVSRAFAYQLMAREEIPTVRLGRAVRVRPQDLESFIRAQTSGKPGKSG